MPLSAGTRLGPYEVIVPIGAGGMGEVYRARDTKLGRDVALKVLPDVFAGDPDRLARFKREAHVLASLNHPNIAHIYGLEEATGATTLVMELVEGPTLADRIARGPILLDEALPIAKQIAEALEAAHEQGIIHRDLKPANVKVRDDGTVKVLDFGLAKTVEPAGASSDMSRSPTITSPAMTQMGMILGTAAYMAPEQAKGRSVDARADVWAFGAVLFEMLSGQRAFDGEDVTEILGAVVRLDPTWDTLPPAVPARIRQAICGCLQRNPKQRLANMQDVRLALEGAFETAAPPVAATAATPPRPFWRRAIPVALGAVLASALTFAAAWGLRPSPPALAVTRSVFSLPEGQMFTTPGRNTVAISPDGLRMVYVANSRLYLRLLSEVDARPITGTETLPSVIKTLPFLLRAQGHVRSRPCRVVFRDSPDVSAALTANGPHFGFGGRGVHHSTEAVTVRARTEWRKSVSVYWGAVSLPVLRRLRLTLPSTGDPRLRPPSARPGWIWGRARRTRTLRIGSSGRPRHYSRLQVSGASETDRLDRDGTASRSPRLWWSPVLVHEGKSGEAR